MVRWQQVTSDPRWGQANPEQRDALRKGYYDRYVAPRVPKGREQDALARFQSQTDKDVGLSTPTASDILDPNVNPNARYDGDYTVGRYDEQEAIKRNFPGLAKESDNPNLITAGARGIAAFPGAAVETLGRAAQGGDVMDGGFSQKVIGLGERMQKPFELPFDATTGEQALYGGLQSAGQSLAIGLPVGIGAGMVATPAVGAVAASATLGAVFGRAEYNSFLSQARDEARRAGKSDSEIKAFLSGVNPEAIASAVAEGGLEFAGDLVLGKVFGFLGKGAKEGSKRAVEAGWKRFAKIYGKTVLTEEVSEVPTAGVQAAMRQRAGLETQSPGKAMAQTVLPTAVSAVPFAGGGYFAQGRGQQAPQQGVPPSPSPSAAPVPPAPQVPLQPESAMSPEATATRDAVLSQVAEANLPPSEVDPDVAELQAMTKPKTVRARKVAAVPAESKVVDSQKPKSEPQTPLSSTGETQQVTSTVAKTATAATPPVAPAPTPAPVAKEAKGYAPSLRGQREDVNVYEYQDANGEKVVHGVSHGRWETGNAFRYDALEGAGDILRELSHNEEGAFSADYLSEKISHVERAIKDFDRMYADAKAGNQDRLSAYVDAYSSQPTKTVVQEAARLLNVALAEGDKVSAQRHLDFIKQETAKPPAAPAKPKEANDITLRSNNTPRQTSSVPAVYVSSSKDYASAYASGRVKDAHMRRGLPRDGVLFEIILPEGTTDIGGDVWKSVFRDAPDKEDFIRKLAEWADYPVEKALKDPELLRKSIEPRDWMEWQDQEQGYNELALNEIPADWISRITSYDADGKVIQDIKGKAKPDEFAEEERRIVYSGSPLSHFPDLATTPAKAQKAEVKEAVVDERDSLIESIVSEARKGEEANKPTVVEIFHLMGSDGNFYNAGGFPIGVKFTGEKKSVGFAFRHKDGGTYGTRSESREAKVAEWEDYRNKKDEEFRGHLREMSPKKLQEQADYWLKKSEAKKSIAPLPALREKRQPKPLVKKVKSLGTGSAEDDARLADYRTRKNLTGGQEKSLKRLESMVVADPSKWNIGDGVGERVTGQISRGYAIVDVEPSQKLVEIKQVADTGLTTSGGNYDKIENRWVHIADLVRDRKYDLNDKAIERFKARSEASRQPSTSPTSDVDELRALGKDDEGFLDIGFMETPAERAKDAFEVTKRMLTTVEARLRSSGKHGNKLADMLVEIDFDENRYLGDAMTELHDLKAKISKEDFPFISGVVDKKFSSPKSDAIANKPEVQAFVKAWHKVTSTIFFRAKSMGVKILVRGRWVPIDDHYISSYIRHELTPKAREELGIDGKARAETVDHLIDTKQAKNEEDALGLIAEWLKYDPTRVTYGSLQRPRLADLPADMYEQNFAKLLPSMLKRSSHFLAVFKQFGHAGAKVKPILAGIATESPDLYNYALKVVELETNGEPSTPGSRLLRAGIGTSANIGLSSPTSGLKNWMLGDVKDLQHFGIRRFMTGYKDLVLNYKQSYDLAMRVSAIESGTHDIEASAIAKWNPGLMHPSERTNRIKSVARAVAYARDALGVLNNKPVPTWESAVTGNFKPKLHARHVLEDVFRLDNVDQIIKRGRFTEKEILRIAYFGQAQAQGTTTVRSMPLWMNTRYGKSSALFYRMAYRATSDVWHNAVKPAARGNLSPLLFFVSGSALSGELLYQLSKLLYGVAHPKDDDPIWERLWADLVHGEGMALLSNYMEGYGSIWETYRPVLLNNAMTVSSTIGNVVTGKKFPADAGKDALRSMVALYNATRRAIRARNPHTADFDLARREVRKWQKENNKSASFDIDLTERSPFYRHVRESIEGGEPDDIKTSVQAAVDYLMLKEGLKKKEAHSILSRTITSSSPVPLGEDRQKAFMKSLNTENQSRVKNALSHWKPSKLTAMRELNKLTGESQIGQAPKLKALR